MRNNFEKQLDRLNKDMIEMGAMCETAINCAIKALLNYDINMAEEAIQIENDINQMERKIENMCLKLLLQQQPVAKDLRMISSALKMITDMERIGDQAADIAEIVTSSGFKHSCQSEHFESMTAAVSKMVTESVDAFVDKNDKLAKDVIKRDDKVDRLFEKIKDDLILEIAKNPKNGSTAIDLIMVAKYLERIGDHAVNIAEWVDFSVTGSHD